MLVERRAWSLDTQVASLDSIEQRRFELSLLAHILPTTEPEPPHSHLIQMFPNARKYAEVA